MSVIFLSGVDCNFRIKIGYDQRIEREGEKISNLDPDIKMSLEKESQNFSPPSHTIKILFDFTNTDIPRRGESLIIFFFQALIVQLR